MTRSPTISLATPTVDELPAVLDALRAWQSDDAPMQLHSGDIGWYWRLGAEATAAAVRTWSRDGRILAVGLLDGDDLLRMTMAPDARRDADLAEQVAADVVEPARGVLPAGRVNLEAPADALLHEVLHDAGWGRDEPWTPLRHPLDGPVADTGVRIEAVGPETAAMRAEVHRSAFGGATTNDERWRAVESGLPFRDGRSLIAFSEAGDAVATVTVWSAGVGRPGLIEPMGVHADHRGHGYGRAISVAAAAALQEMGSSSVLVCTESSNVAAVATYSAAGYVPMPEVRDSVREA